MENKNTIIKKLLQDSPHAMQDLHQVFGFDFCKPFKILQFTGSYTVNQIRKKVIEAGLTPEYSKIVILTKEGKENYYHSYYYYVVEIRNYIDYKIDFKFPYHGKISLDTFYAKKCFEDLRKSKTAETIILAQNTQYIKIPEKYKPDYSYLNRFKFINADYTFITSQNKRIVNRVNVQLLDRKGEQCSREIIGQIIYSGNYYEEDVHQIIDKSGYFIDIRRKDLKQKAAALRKEREKAAYMASQDDAAKIKELQDAVEKTKKVIAAKLLNSNSYVEMKKVKNSLEIFHGLSGAIMDFERFINACNNKQFASIKHRDIAYNNIIKELAEAEEAIA